MLWPILQQAAAPSSWDGNWDPVFMATTQALGASSLADSSSHNGIFMSAPTTVSTPVDIAATEGRSVQLDEEASMVGVPMYVKVYPGP